jgi:membrane protein YqaA with SNARE-associated domain
MAALVIYGGLFVSAVLAATILPVSSEVVLAGLVAAGRVDPTVLFLAATIGNTLGSAVNWLLGRGIDALRDRRWFPISREPYDRASRTFRRFGAWTLPFAWLPLVGDAVTVAARAARMHLGPFLALVALGKATRYAAVIAAGFWAIE